jgi:peptidoglycan/xylan/chitin deacetylase (PgdA/CDA1 family)
MGDGDIGARETIALMYHVLLSGDDVGPGVDRHYAVGVPAFRAQLDLCQRLGGAVVSARDWIAGRRGIIVTFDDGHASHYRVAFPHLQAMGGTADFFVNPAEVGTAGLATWAELAEMARAGMSIQSHGLEHRYLTQLSEPRLRDDLRRARGEIEDRVGRPVTLLAPPGGRRPPGLARIAAEVGYTHVLDSRPGVIRRGQGPTLGRFAITARLETRRIESWLRGGYQRLAAEVRYGLLDLAKRALGDDAYERVRGRLLRRLSGTTPT